MSCGIIGLLSRRNIARNIYFGLLALQHRGQESAGISILKNGKIHTKKGVGLVSDLFSKHQIENGELGIGHVRYSTTGTSSERDAQPFQVDSPLGGIAISHNGNVVNLIELRRELSRDFPFESGCDAEVLLKLLAREVSEEGDLIEGIKNIYDLVDGSFSDVLLTGNEGLVAFRDALGFRPLVWGSGPTFSSESVVHDVLGREFYGDVNPGEVILFRDDTIERERIKRKRSKFCMFEYVYFSRPDSIINGKLVYSVRLKLGEELARIEEHEGDIVVPVPDSSRTAAEGYSNYTGIPVVEGLIKNRYVGRTFIMPTQEEREIYTQLKLNPVRSLVRNRRVILIDDSIVRGTTSRRIVSLLRKAGAKEIHLRVSCPPIVSPCFYGIDMANKRELIAANHSIDEIEKILGVDSLIYQSIDGLVRAIGFNKEELCLGCLTGRYPTPLANELVKVEKSGRLWE